MKTVSDITLYDLMAEDLDVCVTSNKTSGFDLQIDGENGESLVDEKGVHSCAADSFADFCRRYLACYDKVTAQ
jgi:hypothetical protein